MHIPRRGFFKAFIGEVALPLAPMPSLAWSSEQAPALGSLDGIAMSAPMRLLLRVNTTAGPPDFVIPPGMVKLSRAADAFTVWLDGPVRFDCVETCTLENAEIVDSANGAVIADLGIRGGQCIRDGDALTIDIMPPWV